MAVDQTQVGLLPVTKQSQCPSGLLLYVGAWRAPTQRPAKASLCVPSFTVQGLPIESANLAIRGWVR